MNDRIDHRNSKPVQWRHRRWRFAWITLVIMAVFYLIPVHGSLSAGQVRVNAGKVGTSPDVCFESGKAIGITPELLWFVALSEAETPTAADLAALEEAQQTFLKRLFEALDVRFTNWNTTDPGLVGALQNLVSDVATMNRFYDPQREYRLSFHKSIELRFNIFHRLRARGKLPRSADHPAWYDKPEPGILAREYAASFPIDLSEEDGLRQAAIMLHLLRSDPNLREAFNQYRHAARFVRDAMSGWEALREAGKGISFSVPHELESVENIDALRRGLGVSTNKPADAVKSSDQVVRVPLRILAWPAADLAKSTAQEVFQASWSGAQGVLASWKVEPLPQAWSANFGTAPPAIEPQGLAEVCLARGMGAKWLTPSAIASCVTHLFSARPIEAGSASWPEETFVIGQTSDWASLAGWADTRAQAQESLYPKKWQRWRDLFSELQSLVSKSQKDEEIVPVPSALRNRLGLLANMNGPFVWRVIQEDTRGRAMARVGQSRWTCESRTLRITEPEDGEKEQDSKAILVVVPQLDYGEKLVDFPPERVKPSALDASSYPALPYLSGPSTDWSKISPVFRKKRGIKTHYTVVIFNIRHCF